MSAAVPIGIPASALIVALRDEAARSGTVFVVVDEVIEPLAIIVSLRQLAATSSEAIVLVVPTDHPVVERRLLLAAIEPLAVELAPGARLCAVDVAPNATLSAVVAAARYLGSATSTTGQLLRVSG
ncbi:MAG: hypothetical protein K2P79_02920 [Sphingomonas sp.]|nr:hypothetical protein [Sphingomonas sp.]